MKHNQRGSFVVIFLVLLMLIGLTALAGYLVIAKNNSNADVRWAYNEVKNEWYVSQGRAPKCSDPLVFDYSPVDLNLANSIGFPGTYRNKSYKVHGIFALSKSTQVKLPVDATLNSLIRYYEGEPKELQYLIGFETDCGIAFYFDHLYILSPELQKIAQEQPEPKLNNTISSPDDAPPRIKMQAGDIVATATGSHQAKRYGIDFGVIDYRSRNNISKNSSWSDLHKPYSSSEWYGVCWFDMLPGSDSEKAKRLSVVQADTRRVAKHVSDYCKNADFTTLDFNSGQPVDFY